MISSHFSRTDRIVLVFLAFLVMGGVIFSLYGKNSRSVPPALVISALEVPAGNPAGDPPKKEAEGPGFGPVDLNRAGAEELERLPGVGPELAHRILEYRNHKGNFKTVRELLRVAGIGPKKLAQLESRVYISPPAAPAVSSQMKGPAASKGAAPESSLVSSSGGLE